MENSQDNAHYLAIGGLVYAVVSALWVMIAYFFGSLKILIILIASFLLLVLAAVAIRTLQNALKVGPISAGSPELGKWFGIIFAAEGIGIGIGSGVLAGLNQTEWIAPWVAFIVGLHFFPLGRILRLRSDYILGAAILALTLITLLTVPSEQWASLLGLGTALLLWLAGWTRVFFARKNLQRLIEAKK
jgi:hypothetical protein